MNSALSVLNQWKSHVEKAELEEVISMYSDSAILQGTLDPRELGSRKGEQIKGYFINFLSHEVKAMVYDSPSVQVLNDDFQLISGNYNFKLSKNGSLLKDLDAKFSMLMDFSGEKPQILHHISGLLFNES